MLYHIPTKTTYENRLKAKIAMGSSKFNKAFRNGEFMFMNTLKPSDLANV